METWGGGAYYKTRLPKGGLIKERGLKEKRGGGGLNGDFTVNLLGSCRKRNLFGPQDAPVDNLS